MIVVLLVVLLGVPAIAHAQEAPSLRAHRVTVSAGVLWSGGYDVGSATATPFTLLTADSRVSSATGPEIKAGFAFTRSLLFEAGGSVSRPRIGVSITADAEAPAHQLVGEELRQFVIDGSLSWQLPIRLGGRLAPFVIGGGGYLRQLHEDRTLGETGQIYYAGGGARYFLRGGYGSSRPVGLRGDVRVNVRRRGIDFDNTMRAYPTLSLQLFVGI